MTDFQPKQEAEEVAEEPLAVLMMALEPQVFEAFPASILEQLEEASVVQDEVRMMAMQLQSVKELWVVVEKEMEQQEDDHKEILALIEEVLSFAFLEEQPRFVQESVDSLQDVCKQ